MRRMTDLRSQLRAHRKSLSSEAVIDASSQAVMRCVNLPIFSDAKHIAYYISHENEIDCVTMVTLARELKKSLYLPILSDQNTLQFYWVTKKTKFRKNKFGIDEPVVTAPPIDPAQLDLILIPLVAFDVQCHRIGRGAGYYDRALQNAGKKTTLMGLAYEFQKVESIIPEKWDVVMDYIVTEETLYRR